MKVKYVHRYDFDNDFIGTCEDVVSVIKDNFHYAFKDVIANVEKYRINDLHLETIEIPSKSCIEFYVSSQHSLSQCENMLNDIDNLYHSVSQSFSTFYTDHSIECDTWLSLDDTGECSHDLESIDFISSNNTINEIFKCKKCSESFYKKVKSL